MKNVFSLRKRRNINVEAMSRNAYFYAASAKIRYTLAGSNIYEIYARNKIRKIDIDDIPATSKIMKYESPSIIRIDLNEVRDDTKIFLIKHVHRVIYIHRIFENKDEKMLTLDEVRKELD